MADKNDDTFLGGGIKFNSAGAGASPTEPEAEIAPQGMQPHQVKAAIITGVVVVMVIALFVISLGNFGVEPTSGKHHPPVSTAKPQPGDKSY